jgi:hypothetical protein
MEKSDKLFFILQHPTEIYRNFNVPVTWIIHGCSKMSAVGDLTEKGANQ